MIRTGPLQVECFLVHNIANITYSRDEGRGQCDVPHTQSCISKQFTILYIYIGVCILSSCAARIHCCIAYNQIQSNSKSNVRVYVQEFLEIKQCIEN